MKAKLTPKTGLLTLLFYLVGSIGLALIATIFFRTPDPVGTERVIDGYIDQGMYAIIAMAVIMLFLSFFVFRESSRDIFFERKTFALSKFYYLVPLAELAVIVVALTQVNYLAFTMSDFVKVIILTIAIGINEELATRGILLVGLRNGGLAEWKVFALTLVLFSVLHLVKLALGGSLIYLLIVATGGVVYYVTRRVFNSLWVAIGIHALHDIAFYLLPGAYAVDANLPDNVLDIQLGIFLFLLVVSILFLVFGRGLLKDETVGWASQGD